MVEGLIQIEGKVNKKALNVSLANAKPLVVGSAIGFGVIVHVAANSHADLGNALLAFAQVPGVTGVLTLAVRNR